MCGIAGCVAFSGFGETHHALMRRMCGLIAHRGPDDEGFHVEGIGGLGHRRLSIIDLSGGKQPMGSADGQVWLAFNGEIYNYMEVRADLEKLGHRFRTRSDTEVILEGYRAYGPAVAEKLNGMFAYAIWDAPRKRLVLSRDRLGKKPLYYSLRGDSLIFASELKSLLADPSLPREVDPAAVDAFFTYGFVPSPGTILKGIHKLRPGHTLVWEGGDLKVTQYWNVRYEALQGRSEEEWVDAIQDLLEDSVRIRLMSEVPLGAFLSGGLDSSLVVGTMRKLMAGGQVKTFTIRGRGRAPHRQGLRDRSPRIRGPARDRHPARARLVPGRAVRRFLGGAHLLRLAHGPPRGDGSAVRGRRRRSLRRIQ
jgi:asparagine synthase (glutamine-hydrolysing)